MLLAALVLTSAAWLRGAEYDEQYTLFLAAGTPRPAWPETGFAAGVVREIQSGETNLASIAHDLRITDVHPPLYFWTVWIWRRIAGPGLFATRLFSVLCGLLSLAAIGVVARRSGIRALTAMLLTLGSYGFVYTNAIARGFAPAQTLILCGVAMLIGRRGWQSRLAAGLLFGAASCCNYLAVFVAVAASVIAGGWLILPAAAPFLALDAWFFAAQHGTRVGQFPPFDLLSALPRLIVYQVASVFGGLPLSLDGSTRIVAGLAIGALALGLLAAVCRARPLSGCRLSKGRNLRVRFPTGRLFVGRVTSGQSPHADLAVDPPSTGPAIRLLSAAAIASPAGLLLLGAVFNNTPIELRYLSFGVPFIALLTAWACDPTPRCAFNWTRSLLIIAATVQFASIIVLLSASRTMQPARATARAAAALADDAMILLPRGNDGVGIVGAFGIEAPSALPILLVRPTDQPALLRARTVPYRRVVLALIAQDHDSIASLPIMREAFTGPGWRRVATGFNVELYDRQIEESR